MRSKRFIIALVLAAAAALAPSASAATSTPGPAGSPSQPVLAQHGTGSGQSSGTTQQSASMGGSLLLSLFGCTGESGDDRHGGVTGETGGDTGTENDDQATDDTGGDDPYGECEQPAPGGSGG